MDRLISGDVGFGKTEIAVRAAFKAIQDGKQVAMLVPDDAARPPAPRDVQRAVRRVPGATCARCQPLPERQGGEGDAEGPRRRHRRHGHRHAPPSSPKQVQFKDVGLVIIDEEQRFGVEHKDQLKKLKTNVDILAMSATPIPRTLEMAVTGIREMSTLATPPEDRHPILTYVGPVRRQADRRRHPPRAAARGPDVLRAQPGVVDPARSPPSSPSWCPRPASASRTARWASTRWSR